MRNLCWLTLVLILVVESVSCETKPRVIAPQNPNDPINLRKGQNRSVLIVGGSPSGLSAAIELASRGYKVHIVEASEWLGGDYAMMKVDNSTRFFSSLYLPRLYEAIYNNGFQTKNLVSRLGLLNQLKTTDSVYIASPDKSLRSVTANSASWKFYLALDYDFVHKYNCIGLIEMTKAYGLQRTLAAMTESVMRKEYSNITLQGLHTVLGKSLDFYECFLRPFASGTGLGHDQLSAYAGLSRMLYYVTSDSYAVRNSHLHFNVTNDSLNLVSRLIQQLKAFNIKIDTNYRLKGLNANGLNGTILGDMDNENDVYDYTLLAGDVQNSLSILNVTRHMYNGAPKIYLPISSILANAGHLRNAAPVKVGNLWLNKPIADRDQPIIVLSGYSNVERISVLNQLSPQLKDICAKNSTSVIQVVLRDCNEVNCSKTNIWNFVKAQVTSALPDLTGAFLLDAVITDRVGGVQFGLGEEQHRLRPSDNFGVPNLIFSGNWLKTNDYPADGLERDLSLGIEAANIVLLKDQVRQVTLTVANNKGDGVLRLKKVKRVKKMPLVI